MEHKVSAELPSVPQGTTSEQVEQPVVGKETAANKAVETGQSPLPLPPQVPTQIQTVSAAVAATQLPATPSGDPAMPSIADDTDLIEKEWVVKAKEIVARTKQDPYQQNKEVEHMKADYMKKRYNKDIKTSEA